MACNTILGLSLASCDPNNVGGIYEIYIQDQNNVGTPAIDVTGHTITGLTATTDYAVFQFRRNVGELKVDSAIDLLAGSNIHNATITIKLTRREGTKSRAISILGEGQRFLSIIVKGADGQYSYVDYAQLTVTNETTGIKKEDGSSYELTFTSSMDTLPYFVAPAVVLPLITPP